MITIVLLLYHFLQYAIQVKIMMKTHQYKRKLSIFNKKFDFI